MAGEYGYAGKILRVDLTSGSMTDVPTADYARRFLGGRGIAAKIYWDENPPGIRAFDPENQLIFITGLLAGLSGLSGSRWQICGKSPMAEPEHFSYCNLGGSWGAFLKFSGYDGIVFQGKSERPVYLLVQDGTAELRDASSLWGRGCLETRDLLKGEWGNSARAAVIGPAGENQVPMAIVLADDDSSGLGFGAVMGSKRLKAVVARGGAGRPGVASPERIRELTSRVRALKPHGVRDFSKWLNRPRPAENMKNQLCYGCISGCDRGTYQAEDGEKGKFFCQAANFYVAPAFSYYRERNDVPFKASRLCNDYGIDTKVIAAMTQWLSKCHSAGILTDDRAGIPLSRVGSLEFIEALVKSIALRDGFGQVLAQGIHRAADAVGRGANALLPANVDIAGQTGGYDGRIYITNALVFATEPKRAMAQLHVISRTVIRWTHWVNGLQDAYMSSDVVRAIAKTFWGSELGADFSTHEGKALAAKVIQDRGYVIECLGLCDKPSWPIMDSEHTPDHLGDPTLESSICSAVTGIEVDEQRLRAIGERVFNLQRAILIREGHRGRADDRLEEFNYTVPIEADNFNPQCLVPGKDGKPLSKKGNVVDRQQFETMKDEYYELRGWHVPSGLQTRTKLHELGLDDISNELERRGLVA